MVSLSDLPGAIVSLAEFDKWVCWTEKERDGKITKIPLRAEDCRRAAVNKPDDWTSYSKAVARLNSGSHGHDVAGVGFVIDDESPFTCIDLDWKGQVSTPGFVPKWARVIIRQMRSYTEWSPSGYGVHIWIRGKLPAGHRCRTGGVEIYSRDRYITVTGDRLPLVEEYLSLQDREPIEGEAEDTDEIEDRREELDLLHRDLFASTDTKRQAKLNFAPPPSSSPVDPQDVEVDPSKGPWERVWSKFEAMAAITETWDGKPKVPEDVIEAARVNDPDFGKLWDRDPNAVMRRKLREDNSSWDLALCNRLFDMKLDWHQTLSCLMAFRERHVGDAKTLRLDYWANTIARCSSTRQSIQRLEHVKRVMSEAHGLATAPGNDAGSTRKKEVLDAYNAFFMDDRGKLASITFARAPNVVTLTFKDGQVVYDQMESVISWAKFRTILFKNQLVHIPIQQKNWPNVVEILSHCIELEDDSTFQLSYRFREIVEHWAARKTGFPKVTPQNIHGRGPWMVGENIVFSLSEMYNFAVTTPEYRDMDPRTLMIFARSAGCKPHRLGTRRDGKLIFGPRGGIYKIEDPEILESVRGNTGVAFSTKDTEMEDNDDG